jgi:hypothetical protein
MGRHGLLCTTANDPTEMSQWVRSVVLDELIGASPSIATKIAAPQLIWEWLSRIGMLALRPLTTSGLLPCSKPTVNLHGLGLDLADEVVHSPE